MSGSVPKHLIPPDEESRVRALHDLEILDTDREHRFDGLVAELAKKLDVPIAYLALIAEDRQWIKSKVGPLPTHARREDAFCSHTILGDEPMLVADASTDPRFANGPLVQDAPHLRFYAGIPISDRTGHNVGTVCVAGPTPREISPRDVAILEGFAERLEDELNSQPTVLLAYAKQDEELIGRLLATDPRLDDPSSIDLWSSRRAAQGDGANWKLKDALWRARSAVLMVSPAFLDSEWVEDPSLAMLLRARELEEFTTSVVLLEPCDRSAVEWLAARPPWPANDQAITLGSPAEVETHFRDLAIELLGEPPAATAAPEAAAAGAPAPQKAEVRVFLSHAGEDGPAVKELAGRLRQAGLEVWLDVDELQPGDDWMQSLEEALDSSDAFAVYIGRSGIARWIGREVRVALDRNAKDPRYRFIPILGPGADPEQLPRFVAQHHWLDLREGDPQPAEIRKLVASILSRPAEALSLLPPGEAPFRGLLTFGVEHSHLFFGRDEETTELLEKLKTSPFLAVIGDSGSGKSSLVRAGLVPALHRGHFRDAAAASASWRVAVIKPGSDPFRELASGLLDLLDEATPAERMSTLDACAGQLGKGTQGLCNAISALVPKGERTLLIIDQFEEVFTQSHDPDERDRFIDTLLAASNCDGDRPLHTIVTLRADFYSQCFEHPTLPKVMSNSQYAVRAIARDKLPEVIEKPAILAGIKLEPGLVEAILFDLGEGPGNLPLLEHTLLQLWKLRTGETLTHASYEEIGRVQGALEHHAEDVYGKFDEQEKLVARKLLLGLVVPTENAGPARRRAKIAEILPTGGQREAAESVLARLVDERLLMVRGASQGDGEKAADEGEESRNDNEVEVTHEALLRGWRRLGGWLEEDREFLFWRQRAAAAFQAWTDAERDSGALLRGAPLAEAQRWLETRGEDLSEDGRTFIAASLVLAQRQKRIRAAVTAVIAVIGAVAGLFAVVATQARNEAEDSLLLATNAVDEMLTQVGSEALKDVPQLEEVRQELLDRARALYEQLGQQGSSAPGLRLKTALAPARMATIQRQMGDTGWRERLQSAITELDGMVSEEPKRPEYRLELSKIHDDMGWWMTESPSEGGGLAEAAGHLDRAIELQEELVAADPANVEYVYELARSHLNRGTLRSKQEELDAAEADYRAAIDKVEPLASRPGKWNQIIRQQLARAHNNLANLFIKQKSYGEAAERYQLAADLFKSLTADNPRSREYRQELATAYNNLALLQRRNGDPQAAAEHNQLAIALFNDLADALPEIRNELGKANRTQGLVQIELEQTDRAAESLRRASLIFGELLSDYPDKIDNGFNEAVTLLYLGQLRLDAGDAAELKRVRDRLNQLLPLLPEDRQAVIKRLAQYRRIQGNP